MSAASPLSTPPAMTYEDLAAWLHITLARGVGSETTRKLLAAFGLPQQVLAQSASSLRRVASSQQVQAILHPDEATQTAIAATWQWLQQPPAGLQRRVLTLADADYPAGLLNMADPPVLLYATGQVQLLGTRPALALVGSRSPTPQGAQNAHAFAQHLVQHGWTVVSGLALGIDGAAHTGALAAVDTAGAPLCSTIAVVGTGLDRVYPRQHHELAHRIAQHGVLISEYPLGTQPLPHNFPKRNRIIAGLSHGVLVVEAALKSGSLITARLASEQGKEVFAIPGSIHSPLARGCHALIKQGAKLVESAQDIVEELHHITQALPIATSATTGVAQATSHTASTPLSQPAPPDTHEPLEQTSSPTFALLTALGHDPVGLDALLERTGMDAATAQAQLLELELTGHIVRLPGGLFQRMGYA